MIAAQRLEGAAALAVLPVRPPEDGDDAPVLGAHPPAVRAVGVDVDTAAGPGWTASVVSVRSTRDTVRSG
ncbi:hypothetical protein [Streptomyces niveus]|uniref:hypothetical protein n=1 Tax=Streptomyces niveus TaxID=193462 RepID=UPI0036D37A9D